MRKDALTFSTLIARLERAIHCDVGEHGFEILMYGWIVKRGLVNRAMLHQRKKTDGECWLSPLEVKSFSDYAGYDLTLE